MTTQSAPSLPVPFIKGASAKNEVPSNADITLVLPAFTGPTCTQVMLTLISESEDFNRQINQLVEIMQDKDTVVTVSNLKDGKKIFESSHKAKISGSVDAGNGQWIETPESVTYTFID
ncbi:hypothetical protein [Pseudomonas coronafaciens]|uniref:Uncharacterized protein n=1 Tax=Pseudomonas coronafaciens pv. coronafaciens TaxID=235275 RepID=A0AAE6UQK6_9PSED|nr:hypothetical protein [Pseudomonas coronafaciens]QGT83413.1 hypothetical protein GMO17_20710 [Pseudomonas coronafaciens pv. coronafaciens]QIQ71217.1 hypothetical protein HBB04_01582 [Pseudomonas coronafaciens]RMM83983.1 hypothetical protein ALQ71_03089 [Pseudomonas coronafaciens pv. striafaciens]